MSTLITSIGFCTPKSKQIRKTGVAIMVTPVSCPFELVIATSKQLPCEGTPIGVAAFLAAGYVRREIIDFAEQNLCRRAQ